MVNKTSTSSIYHRSMKYKPYETHKSQMVKKKSHQMTSATRTAGRKASEGQRG